MNSQAHTLFLRFSLALLTLGIGGGAAAQTGVSDDRVSLPDGPGSLDGVGDNASVNPNMGMMAFTIPVSVPAGVNGLTPSFDLNYSSGGGNTTFGMGWSMSVGSIERMTSKGLPEYIGDDRFVADGSQELVRISDGEPAVYRARYEGGFSRYSWHNRGAGDEGYWTVEGPGGTINYYGADSTGTNQETARVRSPDGVFRYQLVDTVDVFGNRVSFDYRYYGSVPLLDTVGWVHGSDGTPRYSVQIDYELREDPISDARGGFNEKTSHRATDLRVFSGATQIRRYVFSYEDYATSGGVSRLVDVERFGRDGGSYGIRYSMEYSRALAGVCDGVECDAPILNDAGSIGAGFATGRVNLVDLNADSLPDAIYTPPTGAHRVYLAQMDAAGDVSFAAPFDSAVGDSGTFEMSSPYTQVLDYDGDGFTDLLDSLSGRVLVNRGTGDWAEVSTLAGATGNLPDFSEDFELDGENELTHIRFLDADGDRLVDVLRSDAVGTSLFRNLGTNGFESVSVQDLEAGFADDSTDLADVNGDGLLDPVQVRDGVLRYRLNLGRGNWAAWADMSNMPFDIAEIPFVQLEDLNGDGLDDVVLVQGASVRFALNRNNSEFSAEQVVDSVGGQPLPTVDDTVTVLYADMNANGSNDVVWVDDNGNVQFLDLFPVRPHLLSRLENGIGYTVDVTYGSMARERARDEGIGWETPAPMATLVVNSIDVYAQADTADLIVNDLVNYTYTGGYYDGTEKQFRGFAQATLEQGLDGGVFTSTTTYDLGAGEDRSHFAGLELVNVVSEGGVEIQRTVETYTDCDVADVPETTPPIVWACNVASEIIKKEKAPEAEWATFRSDLTYDGYGNVIRNVDHGVVAIGGGACEPCTRPQGTTGSPCGAQCIGDEKIEEKSYLPLSSVSDAYVVNLVSETRESASEDGPEQVTRFYFDGEPFVGLPAGEARIGLLSRSERDMGPGVDPIVITRADYDAFGNQTHELRPGNPTDAALATRTFYSSDGRDVIRSERLVENGDERITLAIDYRYDPDFGFVSATSGRYIQDVDSPTERERLWQYDEHGRVIALVTPGNSLAAPTEEYSYELGSPYTRLITKKRTEVGGEIDVTAVTCVDGLGRELQKRVEIEPGRFFVDGYNVYDRAGNTTRKYQAYVDTTDACTSPPDSVLFTTIAYDGLDREISVVHPDAEERGEASFTRTEYLPLATRYFNEDDNDPDSPAFNTPSLIRVDGQERMVKTERVLPEGGLEEYTLLYDSLGRLRGYVDPNGNEKIQVVDLADRVVAVTDPDAGDWEFAYNAAGDLIRSTDGRGVTVEREYDSFGRKIAEWDAADRDGTVAEFFYDRHPDCPTDSCTFAAGKPAGSRTQSADGVITEAIGYNVDGDTSHVAREFGGRVLRNDRVTDNAGRVVEESFTGGHRLTYQVDALDRPTRIDGIIDTIRYNDNGQVAGWAAANGVETSFTYDAREDLQRLVAPGVLDLELTRDRLQSIIGVEDGAAPAETSASATFEIDGLSRLTSAAFANETISYATDALLRTTSKTSTRGAASSAHVGTFEYQSARPRAVAQAGDISFDYDSGGFTSTRGADAFSYDALGRLKTLAIRGEEVLSIDRDAYGYRARAQLGSECRHYVGGVFEMRDGVSRLKVKVGDDVVAVLSSSSAAADFFGVEGQDGAVTGADAFAASAGERPTLLRSAARRMLEEAAGSVTYLHQDHLGSTVAVSNADGDVVERLAYYPYGGLRATSAKETEWAAFTNIDSDGTDYYDFKNRVLSTTEGRWLSPDPNFVLLDTSAFEAPAEAFSAYSYVTNNPTTFTDLEGNVSEKTKTRGKWAARVAMAGVSIGSAVGTAVAGFGIGNVIGGIAGGIVGGVVEFKAQRRAYKEAVAAGSPPTSKRSRIANIALQTVSGAASGFASSGLSVVGPALRGVADHVEFAPNASGRTKKAARVLRAVGYGASAATFVFNPLKTTTTNSNSLGSVISATAENGAIAAGVGTLAGGVAEVAQSKTAQKRVKRAAKRATKKAKRAGKKGLKGAKRLAKKAVGKVKKAIKAAKAKASSK